MAYMAPAWGVNEFGFEYLRLVAGHYFLPIVVTLIDEREVDQWRSRLKIVNF